MVTPPYVLLKIPLAIYSREYGDLHGLQTPRAEWGGDFIDPHVCWDSTRTGRHSIGDANTRKDTKKIRERERIAQGSMLAPTLFPRRIIFYSRLNVSISPRKSTQKPQRSPIQQSYTLGSFHMQRHCGVVVEGRKERNFLSSYLSHFFFFFVLSCQKAIGLLEYHYTKKLQSDISSLK